MTVSLQERLESLKAGLIGAIAVGSVYFVAESWHLLAGRVVLFSERAVTVWVQWGANFGGIALSGFLFGVTYRYIIRQDRNSHLRGGAVLAFALVRTSPWFDPRLVEDLSQVWPNLLGALVLNIIGFAAARPCLDLAMMRQWLRPLGTENEVESQQTSPEISVSPQQKTNEIVG